MNNLLITDEKGENAFKLEESPLSFPYIIERLMANVIQLGAHKY